ncbi:MAG TPA: hypothetical protein VF037_03880 [Gemmatimonadales bacterium]
MTQRLPALLIVLLVLCVIVGWLLIRELAPIPPSEVPPAVVPLPGA